MKYFVSACLMGKKCKYNGGHNYNRELSIFLENHEVTLICPEVEGGLSIPRNPVELRDGKAIDREGNEYTQHFINGAKAIITKAKVIEPDCFILQPRSPSCGIGHIYDGTFSSTLIEGNGILVEMLKKEGMKYLSPSDFLAENN